MAVMSVHRVLFFLLIFFLPTQLGLHMWPTWTYILGRQIDYLSPTLYATDVIIVLLLSSWVLPAIFYRKPILHREVYINPWIVFLGITSIVFVAINIYVARNPYVAVYAWVKLLEYIGVGWYIYQQRITLATIVNPLALATLLVSGIGILQYVLQHSLGGIFWYLGERTFVQDTPAIAKTTLCGLLESSCQLRLRAYATFPHPNVFGGFLAVTLPIIGSHLFNASSGDTWKRYIYKASLLFGFIALVLSFSRSAWIVFLFGAIGVVFRIKNLSTFRVPVVIVSSAMVIAAFFMVPIQDESIMLRKLLNDAAVAIWQHAPSFGVGLGNFLLALPATLVSHQVYILQPVHNIYLLTLSQVGVFGVALMVAYGVFFLRAWHKRVHKMHDVYISFLSLLLLGFVDHYLFTLQQGQLIFCVITAISLVSYSSLPNS